MWRPATEGARKPLTENEILRVDPAATESLSRMSKDYSAAALLAALIGLAPTGASADAWAPTGDAALRHDLQTLADGGVFRLPTTTWPIPIADIAAELERTSGASLDGPMAAAMARVKARVQRESRSGTSSRVQASVAENPQQMRGFADTPREDAELGGSVTWQSEQFSVRLAATAVADPRDGQELRADGSYVAGTFGNVLISAGFLDKWWGPGNDGSLILSNNARPMPAITIERARSTPFETPWLSWIGPWRAVATFGMFEGSREDYANPHFFGLRVVARPLPQLEVGISRTAMLCGEGRPCGLDTWWDMFIGNDNADEDLSREDEPGNQLGGFDVRWGFQSVPLALYAQGIGEDEAGFLPSRYLGLFGAEVHGGGSSASWRAYLEYANTACDFSRSSPSYGCAYEHGVYTDGYTYRDLPLGHAADRDAELYTAGVALVNGYGTWNARVVSGDMNRASFVGPRPHAWGPVAGEYGEFQVGWSGSVAGFDVAVQAGWQTFEDVTGTDESDEQLSVRVGKVF